MINGSNDTIKTDKMSIKDMDLMLKYTVRVGARLIGPIKEADRTVIPVDLTDDEVNPEAKYSSEQLAELVILFKSIADTFKLKSKVPRRSENKAVLFLIGDDLDLLFIHALASDYFAAVYLIGDDNERAQMVSKKYQSAYGKASKIERNRFKYGVVRDGKKINGYLSKYTDDPLVFDPDNKLTQKIKTYLTYKDIEGIKGNKFLIERVSQDIYLHHDTKLKLRTDTIVDGMVKDFELIKSALIVTVGKTEAKKSIDTLDEFLKSRSDGITKISSKVVKEWTQLLYKLLKDVFSIKDGFIIEPELLTHIIEGEDSLINWREATTHKSSDPVLNYEKLEQIGDRVFEVALFDLIQTTYPGVTNQKLNDYKTNYASKGYQDKLHQRMNLDKILRSFQTVDINILEDANESFFGCVYIRGEKFKPGMGIYAAKELVRKYVMPDLKSPEEMYQAPSVFFNSLSNKLRLDRFEIMNKGINPKPIGSGKRRGTLILPDRTNRIINKITGKNRKYKSTVTYPDVEGAGKKIKEMLWANIIDQMRKDGLDDDKIDTYGEMLSIGDFFTGEDFTVLTEKLKSFSEYKVQEFSRVEGKVGYTYLFFDVVKDGKVATLVSSKIKTRDYQNNKRLYKQDLYRKLLRIKILS